MLHVSIVYSAPIYRTRIHEVEYGTAAASLYMSVVCTPLLKSATSWECIYTWQYCVLRSYRIRENKAEYDIVAA